MADLDALVAAVAAGDSPEARSAVLELAEIDDDRARAALAGALGPIGALAALAITALARHGAKARSFAMAATLDPDRKVGAIAVLGKIGDGASRPMMRELVADPDPMVRLVVAASLYGAGERDGKLFSDWIRRENDLSVTAVLAAVAGAVPVNEAARYHLESQARVEWTPPEIRAGCAWAVGQHDLALGRELAGLLLAAPETASALASVVRRRGGPLAPLVAGVPGDPAADRLADNVGLPKPA